MPNDDNNQDFNVFSFASNETQLSQISPIKPLPDTQETQMEVDEYQELLFTDDAEDNNINDMTLSQSLCELQLTNQQCIGYNNNTNSNNNRSKMSMSLSLSPLLTK